MNKVIQIGRLTKDIEVKLSNSGTAYAYFTIASNRGKRNGEDLGADFIPCVAYRKNAMNLEKFTKKGDLIYIEGRWNHYEYSVDDETKYGDQCIVDRYEFLSNKKEKELESEEAEDYFPSENDFEEVEPEGQYVF